MKLFGSWAAYAAIFGSFGTAAADKIVFSCEIDNGARWVLSLDLKAKTLRNPIRPSVKID